jgi:tetratricopeptide (TPR) repeat protein
VHYRSVPVGDTLWVSAQRGLACVALGRNDFTSAIEPLSAVKAEEGEKASLDNLLALTLREAGQTQEAIQIFKQILSRDPLNLLVLRELSMLDAEQGQMYASKLQTFWDDQQYILDLAALYLDGKTPLMQNPSWKRQLQHGITHALLPGRISTSTWICPIAQLSGRKRPARKSGASVPKPAVGNYRHKQAIDQYPQDDKAKYYLGNFLYAHQCYEEAIRLWEQACRSGRFRCNSQEPGTCTGSKEDPACQRGIRKSPFTKS